MASRFLAPISGGRGYEPLMELHREMNRLFDDVFSGAGALGPAGGGGQGGLLSMPRLDVREGEKELCVSAELPGVKESDIELRLEGDVLTLSGEKRNEVDREQENFHLMERSYGQFRRSVRLPFAPEPDQVQASFEHGVLTIRMPRPANQQRSRRIEIHHGGGASQEAQLQHAGDAGRGEEGMAAQGVPLQQGGGAQPQGAPSGASTH